MHDSGFAGQVFFFWLPDRVVGAKPCLGERVGGEGRRLWDGGQVLGLRVWDLKSRVCFTRVLIKTPIDYEFGF